MRPKLSDSVDSHRVPMGSAVRMGRRNLFPGRLNGSRAAQILPESPGIQRPTTETTVAACEEVIETPGASAKPGSPLRRPMRTADPIGPSRKNQNWNRSTQVQRGLRREWVSGMNAAAGRMRRGLALAALTTALVGCAQSVAYTPVETHTRPGRLSAAAKTVAVAIADLDNDGNLDVVAGAGEPGAITISYGDGAGSLVETQTLSVEGDVRSVALADVNEDGLTDIIYSVQRQSSGIRIMLNQGGRRWKSGKGPIEINTYEGLRAADVNGDGHVDIVAANASSDLQGGIQVWLGTGQGTWTVGSAPTVTGIYMDVAVADFNGDGRLDIAGAGWGMHGALRVWLGNPAGGWTALAPVSRGNFYGLHVADINGDGRLDLAAGTYKTGVRLFIGDGQGGFTEEFISKNDSAEGAAADAGARPALAALPEEVSFWQALPVDVDGDGRPDIVAGSLDYKGVQVWLNQAGKGWKPIADMYPRTGTFYGLAAADLNKDGRPDICAANFGEGVTLWAGRTPGAGATGAGIAAAVAAEPRPGNAALRENDVFKVVNGTPEYKIGAGDVLEIALWEGSTAGAPGDPGAAGRADFLRTGREPAGQRPDGERIGRAVDGAARAVPEEAAGRRARQAVQEQVGETARRVRPGGCLRVRGGRVQSARENHRARDDYDGGRAGRQRGPEVGSHPAQGRGNHVLEPLQDDSSRAISPRTWC